MSQATDGHPCVLVVEDNEQVRRFVGVVLSRYGVAVRTAADGESAVAVYRAHRDEIALVLSDVQMPGLDGPALLARLQAINPEVRCWFMSGSTGVYSKRELLDWGACGLLSKPFCWDELEAVLVEAGVA